MFRISAYRGRTRAMWGTAAALVVCFAAGASGQTPIPLDETCTVSVGNQTVQVRPDGTFFVPNISVFRTRLTRLAPQLYRVRATCLRDGAAITGQSVFFEMTPAKTAFVADVFPSALDPIPVRIEISASGNSLPLGDTLQLQVTAHFADGSTEDRTSRASGTTYLSTNSRLLSVDLGGLVTGANSTVSPQAATIAVLNEGNIATIAFTAVGGANDFDNDGMPDDYEDLFGLNKFVNDADGDLDGDQLSNIDEFNLGTIPNNPDTDGDGVIDGLDGDPLRPEESPPTVVITSPSDGATLFENQTILFTVDATDDGLLASVALSNDRGFAETLTEPPFQVSLVVPEGVGPIVFTATATDGVPNVSSTAARIIVVPDPLTTVIGSVVDGQGDVVAGAMLTTNGGLVGTTEPDGSFTISGVPNAAGPIVVRAVAQIGGSASTGQSDAVPSVPDGVTNVGVIALSGTAIVGYYDLFVDGGNEADQVPPIEAAGHTAVNIGRLATADLSEIDVLFVQNPGVGGYGFIYPNNLQKVFDFVESGGVLVFHDRHVITAAQILPGPPIEFEFEFDFAMADVNIVDNTTLVTDGPGGVLTDDSLDDGRSSTHGYVLASDLPAGAVAILSRAQASEIVTFKYDFGLGAVVYSTIPLDAYLDGQFDLGPNEANFRDIYAPNVIDYAASLRGR